MALTQEQKEDLKRLENIKKWELYGNIFKGTFAVLTVLSFRLHIFAGVLMSAAFMGMLEGTKTSSINSSRGISQEQENYYQLRYLQILNNDD